MPKPIEIYVQQIDPSTQPEKMDGPIGAPAVWEAYVPAGQLLKGQLPIRVERDTHQAAVSAAKVAVRRVMSGRGAVRFKVIERD